MCGIIAVLRRRRRRQPPSREQIEACLSRAAAHVSGLDNDALVASVNEAATALGEANTLLSGSAGATCLYREPDLADATVARLSGLTESIRNLERHIDDGLGLSPHDLESLNAALVRVKDSAWAVSRDCVGTSRAIADLGGEGLSDSSIEGFMSIAQALSALDRLEVRGRDSAGLHVLVSAHGLDLSSQELRELIEPRKSDRLFTSRAVRTPEGHLCFVYKTAAEIGELGDNTRALRAAIRDDALLRRALSGADAEAVVLGHTRWASVGIVSQPNAHPVNHEEEGRDGPYVCAVLNGDVDNFIELRDREGLKIAPEITTDTKVIPTLVSRRLGEGLEFGDAFRQTVASFVGSVAIGCQSAKEPDKITLALRGSGQGVFVGLAEDAFLVASEPYGVVEATSQFLRLDGETPGNPENPSASQGQIVVLSRGGAGEVSGIERVAYDGTMLPVTVDEIQTAEITTRDIDRGDNQHYLLKEISESPKSFAKTLRGKIIEEDGKLLVRLSDESLPAAVRDNLAGNVYGRVIVIGQGTAAVAGQGVAAAISDAFSDTSIAVEAMPATELSGFRLRDDMSDTLIVAISQSGTTTDTNRTVDLVRGRGASVLSIVNRRNSDLTDKSDGVLYTSDGRDVEMSVASTKAFYSQIAAGFLLAIALRQELGKNNSDAQQELLAALRSFPDIMREMLRLSDGIRNAARKHAPQRRYWAVVGNGTNLIAAEEIRIKLSELCYKSIACDTTEDKKHIDLSAEPLILVCAAGLVGSTASDVAKEIAIYHAHKAAPILITSDDPSRYPGALETIQTPDVHPALAYLLSTMAGHLFGYYAALAIDELAHPLRLLRSELDILVSDPPDRDDLLPTLERRAREPIAKFHAEMAKGRYDGQLEASTAVRLHSHLAYLAGLKPLESYETESSAAGSAVVGTPALVIENLAEALTRAIEELTRPVDAIKHQAKTVTVGISRSDEDLVTVPLVKSLLEAGAPRDRISYRTLRALGSINPAVADVLGSTRYEVKGNRRMEDATVRVVSTTGISDSLASRTATDPRLRGTKHLVAVEREILVARGRSDNRTVIIVPEVQAGKTTGLTLLHIEFHERISSAAMRGVLSGYRHRYSALRDLVTETEPTFDEELLATIPVLDLLTTPVHVLADSWRRCAKD